MASPVSLRIRAFQEADYEALARVRSLADPGRPTNSQSEREQDERALSCYRRRRWTAEAVAGPVGFGEYEQNHRTPPDCYLMFLVVDPAYLGRGIGGALYREVMETLGPLGAHEVITNMASHLERGVHFFQDRGFCVKSSSHRMRLDVASFCLDPWRAHIDSTAAQGYLFSPLSRVLEDARGLPALWRLHSETEGDVPARYPPAPESVGEFRRRVLESPNLILDGSFAAWSDETNLAGVTEIWRTPGADLINVGFTGVSRFHRGKGIGLALKLLSVDYARRSGFRHITTNNDRHNTPMLAINKKVGFREFESRLILTRQLQLD